MKTPQEIREIIIEVLAKRETSTNKMLQECNLHKSLLYDMARGQMPSADKMLIVAQYLDVSVEYLMGVTDDPMPPKRKE